MIENLLSDYHETIVYVIEVYRTYENRMETIRFGIVMNKKSEISIGQLIYFFDCFDRPFFGRKVFSVNLDLCLSF